MFLTTSEQPVDPATIDDTEEKRLLRILWLSYLNMWGPRFDHPGRKQHHWRLHQIMDFMDKIRGEAGLHPGPEWSQWVKTLPGFVQYWNNPVSYARHHYER